ncbi:hypothetical protein Tco_0989671, partial [Tanacetum coccineum]
LPAAHGPIQPWISNLAQKEDTRDSFNEPIDTPLDFLTFVMNRLKVDTLTPELLAGPTFDLMKGSCKSMVELEYFLEEVYKATTDQFHWNNPEGQQYPHDLCKPLPLIPNSQGRRVIPFDHFINNVLAYLKGSTSSRTYATSVTKTKAADYGHAKWIEDLVPNTMWSPVPVIYDKYALSGSLLGSEASAILWDLLSTGILLHLDWITVRRNDEKMYTFKEGDYKRLRLQDIKDMLLILVQGKLTNLTIEERLALNVSLRMFTRRRVEDLQLGVKSYQKKLNLTRPDTYRSYLKRLPTYSAYPNPRGFIYQNKDKKNKLMRIDELHKFSDGTLNDVQTVLDDILNYEAVRHRYSNPMIQPELEGSTHGYPLVSVEVLRGLRMKKIYTVMGVKKESPPLHLERFYTSAGNPVKEILLKLNLPDHRILKDGGEGPKGPWKAHKAIPWPAIESTTVDIKSLLDAVRITDAQDYVNTTLMKLVLLMNFKENIVVFTIAGTKVNDASESYYCYGIKSGSSEAFDKAWIRRTLFVYTRSFAKDMIKIMKCAASKVPMLKPGEFEIWRMRIEQYIQMIDYALWEVIKNGATLPKTITVEGVMTVLPITTAKEKAQRRLEVKARSTLMMGIPNEHQLLKNTGRKLNIVNGDEDYSLGFDKSKVSATCTKWGHFAGIAKLQEIKDNKNKDS